MDMSKYKVETIPPPPVIKRPNREEFCNNADWGAALDQWEVEVEERKQVVEEIRKKNNAAHAEAYDRFKRDLREDLGWEWMTDEQFSKAMSHAYERGHHAGHDEVYAIACELDELLSAFKP